MTFAQFDTTKNSLEDLLKAARDGKLQLPDFQRGWVWDDYDIRSLLASVSQSFPIGAIMTLQTGGEVRFRPRLIEGAVVEAAPLDPPDRPLMLLKDRLYLGYQPVTDSIEVISYNEAAGRFEFQVVADYRAGGAPTVYYTERAVCIGCHQNHAPIFAGEPWEASNSNPKIGALLELEQPSFYGISSFVGIDIPGLIGNAIDRATMFAAYQFLWREGCGAGADGIACRANVFLAV